MFKLKLTLVSTRQENLLHCMERIQAALCAHGRCIMGRAGWTISAIRKCIVILTAPRPRAAQLVPVPLPASYETPILIECMATEDVVELVELLNTATEDCKASLLVTEAANT